MLLTTRKQRISFDVRSDLEARHKIHYAFKAWTNNPKPNNALVRTESFIECKVCKFINTKYADHCVSCSTQLSTRPAINKFL